MSKYLNQDTSDEACLLFEHIFTDYEYPISLTEATYLGGLTRSSAFHHNKIFDEFDTIVQLTQKSMLHGSVDRHLPCSTIKPLKQRLNTKLRQEGISNLKDENGN
jgi:hypothetical protein